MLPDEAPRDPSGSGEPERSLGYKLEEWERSLGRRPEDVKAAPRPLTEAEIPSASGEPSGEGGT